MTLALLSLIIISILIIGLVVYLKYAKKATNKYHFQETKEKFISLTQSPVKSKLRRIQKIAFNNPEYNSIYYVWKKELNNVIVKYEEIISKKISKLKEQRLELEPQILEEEITKINWQIDTYQDKISHFLGKMNKFLKLEEIFYESIAYYQELLRKIKIEIKLKKGILNKFIPDINAQIQKIDDNFKNFNTYIAASKYTLVKKEIHNCQENLEKLILIVNVSSQENYYLEKKIPEIIGFVKKNLNELVLSPDTRLDFKSINDKLTRIETKITNNEDFKAPINFTKVQIIIEQMLNKLNIINNKIETEKKAYAFFVKKFIPLMKEYNHAIDIMNYTLNEGIKTNNYLEIKSFELKNFVLLKNNLDLIKQEYKRLITNNQSKKIDYTSLFSGLKNLNKLVIRGAENVIESFSIILSKGDLALTCNGDYGDQKLFFSNIKQNLNNLGLLKNVKVIKQNLNNANEILEKVGNLLKVSPRDYTKINSLLRRSSNYLTTISDICVLTSKQIKNQEKSIMLLKRYKHQSPAIKSKLENIEIYFKNKDYKKTQDLINQCLKLDIIQKRIK